MTIRIPRVERLRIPCEQGIAQTVIDGRFNLQPGSGFHPTGLAFSTEMTDVFKFKMMHIYTERD